MNTIVMDHNSIKNLFSIAPEIYRKTIENQGCSMNLDHYEPESGYMVSYIGTEQRVDILGFNAGHIDSFIRSHMNLLFNKNLFIGTWVNGDQVVIDISQNLQNKQAAIAFGRDNKQDAIYDVVNGDSINL